MKTYSLTKQELEGVQSLMPAIIQYQQVLQALELQFKHNLISGAFKRLDIPVKLVEFARIELSNGELIIEEPKEDKNPEAPAEPVKVG